MTIKQTPQVNSMSNYEIKGNSAKYALYSEMKADLTWFDESGNSPGSRGWRSQACLVFQMKFIKFSKERDWKVVQLSRLFSIKCQDSAHLFHTLSVWHRRSGKTDNWEFKFFLEKQKWFLGYWAAAAMPAGLKLVRNLKRPSWKCLA